MFLRRGRLAESTGMVYPKRICLSSPAWGASVISPWFCLIEDGDGLEDNRIGKVHYRLLLHRRLTHVVCSVVSSM